MPLVSILIPAYRPQYLDLAIASALAQTFQDFELLISDDSSDPAVALVACKWEDPRIRYFRNPRRQQPGANRDYLLGLASGRYIKFLFDDDFLLPTSIATLVSVAGESGSQLVFHGRHQIDERGCVLSSPQTVPAGQWQTYARRDFFERLIGATENFVGEPTCILFEAEAYRKLPAPFSVAGFPMRFLTDVSLYINFVAQGYKATGVGLMGAAFRHHGEQTSNKTFAAYSAGLFEWELFMRWAVDAGDMEPARYARCLAHLHVKYRRHVEDFPELAPLLELSGAPGPEGFVSSRFRQVLAGAYAAIEDRRRSRLAARSA
jgi:glycosyltransferase involved in cell wall biosynthesis